MPTRSPRGSPPRPVLPFVPAVQLLASVTPHISPIQAFPYQPHLTAAASPLVMLSHPLSSSRPPSSLFLPPRLPLIPFNTPHWAITVPPFVFTAPSRPPRYYPPFRVASVQD